MTDYESKDVKPGHWWVRYGDRWTVAEVLPGRTPGRGGERAVDELGPYLGHAPATATESKAITPSWWVLTTNGHRTASTDNPNRAAAWRGFESTPHRRFEVIALAPVQELEYQSKGQDLAEWRGQIEDECVRLKSSGDETALEALLWVLEDVLPMPVETEQQSITGDGSGESLPDAANVERDAPATEHQSEDPEPPDPALAIDAIRRVEESRATECKSMDPGDELLGLPNVVEGLRRACLLRRDTDPADVVAHLRSVADSFDEQTRKLREERDAAIQSLEYRSVFDAVLDDMAAELDGLMKSGDPGAELLGHWSRRLRDARRTDCGSVDERGQ